MQHLSNLVRSLSESETLKMAKISRELASQGLDIINLNLGEPDFDVPAHIQAAAKQAIDDNVSHYPPLAGYPELRKAISEKFKRENNVDFAPDQVVVSTGAKQSIANVVLSLINPGDEVLVPTPFWVSYKDIITLAGGIPVYIKTTVATDFKVKPEQLEQAITERSRLFMFSSPSNPTGVVYTKEELQGLATVFARHPQITILSDEIYEHIQFARKHETIAQFPEVKDRTVIVNGLSKSFAMTGWRIGYIGAPKWIAEACEKIQGQITSGTSSVMQRAAITAINGDLEPTLKMCAVFKKRMELMVELFSKIPGVKFAIPEGAFYIFPDVSHYFGKRNGDTRIANASDLAMYLLYQAHVSLVAGDAFGDPNCIRIAFSISEEKIAIAVERIRKALSELK